MPDKCFAKFNPCYCGLLHSLLKNFLANWFIDACLYTISAAQERWHDDGDYITDDNDIASL